MCRQLLCYFMDTHSTCFFHKYAEVCRVMSRRNDERRGTERFPLTTVHLRKIMYPDSLILREALLQSFCINFRD